MAAMLTSGSLFSDLPEAALADERARRADHLAGAGECSKSLPDESLCI
jgi:hypothetical protein